MLVLNASLLCERPPASSSRTIPTTFANTVKEFALQIEHLFERWSTALASQPNEIWGSSIQAWSQCEFLISRDIASVTALSADDDLDWILVDSETSSDGREVGTIKVLPPPQLRSPGQYAAAPTETTSQNIDDLLHNDWKAKYTI